MGTLSMVSPASLAAISPPAVTPDFADLYKQWSATVYRTALRVTGNQSDAEDVLQNVFLRLWNRPERIDPAKSPAAYLKRSATNAAIDLLRSKSTRPETTIEDRPDIGAESGQPLQREELRRALARLPERDASLFCLCYLEGLSYDELAELFDMERPTVASRLHRIKKALQSELGK